MDDLIKQGADAFRAGNRDEARKLLLTAVKQNPDSERAWGWLYNVANNDQERVQCLKQMLRINPKNEKANQLLNQLTGFDFSLEMPPQTKEPLRQSANIPDSQKQKSKNNRNLFWIGGAVVVLLICLLVMVGGYIIYDLNRSSPVAVLPPTLAPLPTLQPTQPLIPTNTPQPTKTPSPSETPMPPTATPKPIGTLRVDQWELVITRVLADPGKDASRQNLVVFAMITNHGSQDTFSPNYKIELLDSKGKRYTDDLPATFSAQDKYGVDRYAGVSMSPESTELVLFAYETPAGENTFTLVPGDLAGSWSGNITFQLP